MHKAKLKVLFFMADAIASESELDEIAALDMFAVMPRNASALTVNEALEDCDGVAGLVPTGYAERCVPVSELLAAYEERMAERAAARAAMAAEPAKVAEPAKAAKVAKATAAEPSATGTPAWSGDWKPQ
jgi:hypothetical protein